MSFIDSDLDVFLQEPFGQEVEYSGGLRMGVLDMPDQILSGDMIYSTDYVLQVKTKAVSYTHLTLPTTPYV